MASRRLALRWPPPKTHWVGGTVSVVGGCAGRGWGGGGSSADGRVLDGVSARIGGWVLSAVFGVGGRRDAGPVAGRGVPVLRTEFGSGGLGALQAAGRGDDSR